MPTLKKSSLLRRFRSFRCSTPKTVDNDDADAGVNAAKDEDQRERERFDEEGRRLSVCSEVEGAEDFRIHPLETDVVAASLMPYLPLSDLYTSRLVCQTWNVHASNQIITRMNQRLNEERENVLRLCDHDHEEEERRAEGEGDVRRLPKPDYVGGTHLNLTSFLNHLEPGSFILRMLPHLHVAVLFSKMSENSSTHRFFALHSTRLTRIDIWRVGQLSFQKDSACVALFQNWGTNFPNVQQLGFYRLPCIVQRALASAEIRTDADVDIKTKLVVMHLYISCTDCACRRAVAAAGSSQAIVEVPPPVPGLAKVNSIVYSLILNSPILHTLTLNLESARLGVVGYLTSLLRQSGLQRLEFLTLYSTRAEEISLTILKPDYQTPYRLKSLLLTNVFFSEDAFAPFIRPHRATLQHLRYLHEVSIFFPNLLMPEDLPHVPRLFRMELSVSPVTGLPSINFSNVNDIPTLQDLTIREINGVFELQDIVVDVPVTGFTLLKKLTVGFSNITAAHMDQEYQAQVEANFDAFLRICPNLIHLSLEHPPTPLVTSLWTTQRTQGLRTLELKFSSAQSVCCDTVLTGFKKLPSRKKILKGIKNLCRIMESTRSVTGGGAAQDDDCGGGGGPSQAAREDNALVLRAKCRALIDKWRRSRHSGRIFGVRSTPVEPPAPSVADLHNLKKLIISCDAGAHEFTILSVIFFLTMTGLRAAGIGSFSMQDFDYSLLMKLNGAMEGTSIRIIGRRQPAAEPLEPHTSMVTLHLN